MDAVDFMLVRPSGLQEAVNFIAGNSRAVGDNRRRALLARRLKHVPLAAAQQEWLLMHILEKFRAGAIDEQFMDQLRLCLRLDPVRTLRCARNLQHSDKAYIQRCAGKVLRSGRPGLTALAAQAVRAPVQ